jgi:mono/diheme cytochrome c family protein
MAHLFEPLSRRGIAMRSNPKFAICWSAVAIFLITTGGEAAAADRMNGYRIAARWCAECHIIDSEQTQGSDQVPTFAQIGEAKRFDQKSLTVFLTAPHHSRMPNLSLTRAEIADLLAYIKSRGR